MSGLLFIPLAVGAICVLNYFTGRRWSQLDHNPWTGKFLGGSFHTPNPGWNPGALSVEEINKRGRQLMKLAPVAFVLGNAFFLFIIYLQTHPVSPE